MNKRQEASLRKQVDKYLDGLSAKLSANPVVALQIDKLRRDLKVLDAAVYGR